MHPRTRFIILSFAAALGVLGTLSLGFWQMDRAEQKLTLQTSIEDKKSLSAGTNNDLLAIKNIANEYALHHHRPMVLTGQWLHEHNIFLDNRQMRGRQGFYVLTPLRLAGSDQVIVVQRGWVARDFQDRSRLPTLPQRAGQVLVQGRLAPPPAKLYEFAGAEQGAIRQNLDLVAFAAQIRQPLLLASLVQTEPTDEADAKALLRDWPTPATGVDRHHGYAAQWFALSALIALLYVWFQFIAPRRTQRRSHG